MLSLGKIWDYKGKEQLEALDYMAKPAFVGVLDEPTQLPVVCRVSLFTPDLPPEWESVVQGLLWGWFMCSITGCFVGNKYGEDMGQGFFRRCKENRWPSSALGFFKCVLEEPFSSPGDSSVCKLLLSSWKHVRRWLSERRQQNRSQRELIVEVKWFRLLTLSFPRSPLHGIIGIILVLCYPPPPFTVQGVKKSLPYTDPVVSQMMQVLLRVLK